MTAVPSALASMTEAPTHLDRFRAVLDHVQYKNWTFHVAQAGASNVHWLQIRFEAPDTDRVLIESVEKQHGRKWMLSTRMTDGEVIQTALKAVLAAEEHEAREQFLVLGVATHAPHYDPIALALLVKTGQLGTSVRGEG